MKKAMSDGTSPFYFLLYLVGSFALYFVKDNFSHTYVMRL